MMYSPITDVDWITEIEELDPSSGWGLWEVEVTVEDGYTMSGTIQGDGVNWAPETFVADEDDLLV